MFVYINTNRKHIFILYKKEHKGEMCLLYLNFHTFIFNYITIKISFGYVLYI